jgi:hypothetical protein
LKKFRNWPGAYPIVKPLTQIGFSTLPANIRLRWTGLPRTNTLTYDRL